MEVLLCARQGGLQRLKRFRLRGLADRPESGMYGETDLTVARFHGLGNPLRQLCHRWRDNVPDRLVLVAQAVLVDGVLEERLGEIGISDLLDRVKPLVRLPERVVRVQLQNVGKAIEKRSQLARASLPVIMRWYFANSARCSAN